MVAGGNRFNPNGKDGFFYEPTILADVQEGVRIVDEEQVSQLKPVRLLPVPPFLSVVILFLATVTSYCDLPSSSGRLCRSLSTQTSSESLSLKTALLPMHTAPQ
eukprot:COSAG02_NODE_38_length_48090_cov_107.207060_23_plen_104_part_00